MVKLNKDAVRADAPKGEILNKVSVERLNNFMIYPGVFSTNGKFSHRFR